MTHYLCQCGDVVRNDEPHDCPANYVVVDFSDGEIVVEVTSLESPTTTSRTTE